MVGYYNEQTVAESGIQSLSCHQHRVIGMSLQDLRDLREVAATLISAATAAVNSEKARVLALVRSKPLEEILAAGIAPRGEAGMSAVSEARKRKDHRFLQHRGPAHPRVERDRGQTEGGSDAQG